MRWPVPSSDPAATSQPWPAPSRAVASAFDWPALAGIRSSVLSWAPGSGGGVTPPPGGGSGGEGGGGDPGGGTGGEGGGSTESDYIANLNATIGESPGDYSFWFTAKLGTDWPRLGSATITGDGVAYIGALFALPPDTPDDYPMPSGDWGADPVWAQAVPLLGENPFSFPGDLNNLEPYSAPIVNAPPAGWKLFVAVYKWFPGGVPTQSTLSVGIHLHLPPQ